MRSWNLLSEYVPGDWLEGTYLWTYQNGIYHGKVLIIIIVVNNYWSLLYINSSTQIYALSHIISQTEFLNIYYYCDRHNRLAGSTSVLICVFSEKTNVVAFLKPPWNELSGFC